MNIENINKELKVYVDISNMHIIFNSEKTLSFQRIEKGIYKFNINNETKLMDNKIKLFSYKKINLNIIAFFQVIIKMIKEILIINMEIV